MWGTSTLDSRRDGIMIDQQLEQEFSTLRGKVRELQEYL
jgi:hypothetical protein